MLSWPLQKGLLGERGGHFSHQRDKLKQGHPPNARRFLANLVGVSSVKLGEPRAPLDLEEHLIPRRADDLLAPRIHSRNTPRQPIRTCLQARVAKIDLDVNARVCVFSLDGLLRFLGWRWLSFLIRHFCEIRV
jgi:hypothetical protein